MGGTGKSTRDLASQVEIRGLCFCRNKLSQRAEARNSEWEKLGGGVWITPTFPRGEATLRCEDLSL